MSESLHLKYRPSSLDEVIGNADIVHTIKGMLADTMPKSILLHGPTGCGKTTLARIIAKEVGAKGGDLIEMDSADFRGIDAVRDIRKHSKYAPLESDCRVWILDECHRMTGDAQSALLKILEDTPPHVYFILCTTDPQKLLSAILGRCAGFQVAPLTDREMTRLLHKVAKAEDDSLQSDICKQIVQDSQGHPRNALQILAQVLAVEEDRRLKIATQAAECQSKTIELCRALTGAAPWSKVAGILSGLKDEDPEQIRRAVLGYCQTILLKGQPADGVAGVMEEFIEPFYNVGMPGLTLACYRVLFSSDE